MKIPVDKRARMVYKHINLVGQWERRTAMSKSVLNWMMCRDMCREMHMRFAVPV